MPRQLGMFSPISAATSSTSVVGLTIKVHRPADPGHRRCDLFATIGSSKGILHNAMVCNSCGKSRGWLGGQAVDFINETRRRFGAPEVITIRSFPRTSPAPAARSSECRR
jgi:hypothetical protein